MHICGVQMAGLQSTIDNTLLSPLLWPLNFASRLQRKQFHDFSVLIPNRSEKILNTYFKCNDWMEYCVPSVLNHREHCPTGFPAVKKPLKEVLVFIESGG